LSDSRPVLRFAPSPNGRLHLGHAYSALCNARLAERLDGRLLLRIENLDASRCKPEFETALVDDLDWLGLRFQSAPRRQSEHIADYYAVIETLYGKGLVYPCLCSRSDVAAMAAGARDPDGAPRHGPRACRRNVLETQELMTAGASAAWRLDMRETTAHIGDIWRWLEFGEGLHGEEREGSASAWGDVLLTGASRAASYHLAVVLDDALQGVTDVVRGRDLFAATALHRLLQDLLFLPPPNYHHHRLVMGEAGVKLSKSLKSPSLAALREQGSSAADVRKMLGFGDAPASVALA
jgi:glutamyl-Q tRNA(Asp) synthetase